MSQNIDLKPRESHNVAPTPQNTPLQNTVLSSRPAGQGKPTVEAIGEDDDGEEETVGANPASLLAANPALLNMVHGKLDGLVGRDSGYISSLPAVVKRRIEGLKGIQAEHSKIENEFQLAILEVEKQFLQKYTPLYERRLAIISGKAEPTEDEIAAAESDDEESDDEDEARVTEINEDSEAADADVKGVPEFWLTALQNHRPLAEQITERDEEALRSLTDIRLSYIENSNQPGFKLHFTFAPNDFFENTELVKTYYYQEKVGYGGDFVYDKAEGCEIQWKEEKDLTKKVEIKKQKNKNTNKTRTVKKILPTDSFFNFFKPPQPPSMEALENQDVDEAELEELDERLEVDYQIGEDFKEKIIPRAVDYFTGKALQYDDQFDEDYDEDDEDDYSDEDDEEGGAPQQAGEGQDCKQQ